MLKNSESKILQLIIKNKRAIRTQLAEQSGYGMITVTGAVNKLLERRIITECGAVSVDAGRRPTMLEINKDYGYAIVLDIGMGSLKTGAVDMCGGVLCSEYTQGLGYDNTQAVHIGLDEITEKISAIYDRYGHEKCIGIGIGVTGIVDHNQKKITFCPNIAGFNNFDIVSYFEQKYPSLPVLLDTSARCMALGESLFTDVGDVDNLLLLTVGWSIQLGIILNRSIYRGATGAAGEIGHMKALLRSDKDCDRCACGNYGCLELYVTVLMIQFDIQKRFLTYNGYSPAKDMFPNDMKPKFENLKKAYQLGDKIVTECVYEASTLLTAHLSTLVNVFNPEVLILTGTTFELFPDMIDYIRLQIRSSALVPSVVAKLKILPSSLPGDPHLIGAAAQVIQHFFNSLGG